MENFIERLRKHAEHVKNVGSHCTTEETTKQALILPLLDILGFSPFDPTRVKAEYGADFPGVKSSERVDYALFCHGVPVMFIEAKAYAENLSNHSPQLSRYFNATPEVTIGAITNGLIPRVRDYFTDSGSSGSRLVCGCADARISAHNRRGEWPGDRVHLARQDCSSV